MQLHASGRKTVVGLLFNLSFLQETTDQQVAAFIRSTYLGLPPWAATNTSSVLKFNFRTRESSSLILFHGDVEADYVAIVLEGGVLKTTLQIG